MSKKGSSMKYFSEDNAGFRIQPKTVLIVSLVYIGIVVLLHIFSKVNSSKAVETPQAPNQ
jgi:protein transport protein SEC61 subunit beta